MKRCESWRPRTQFGIGLSLLILAFILSGVRLAAEDAKPQNDNPSPKESAPRPRKAEKKPSKKLNGAELYALHCNRCHPERYATERTADQWKTILLHMRTRANLPAEQARAILQFLQEDTK